MHSSNEMDNSKQLKAIGPHFRTAAFSLQAASASGRLYPNRSPCSKTSGVLERPTRRRIFDAPRLRTLKQPEAEGCGPPEFSHSL